MVPLLRRVVSVIAFVPLAVAGSSCGGSATSAPQATATVATALGMCDTASAAAYAKGGKAIQIYTVDNQEMAISVKGTSCIGEP
jgi:phosphate-selective porin